MAGHAGQNCGCSVHLCFHNCQLHCLCERMLAIALSLHSSQTRATESNKSWAVRLVRVICPHVHAWRLAVRAWQQEGKRSLVGCEVPCGWCSIATLLVRPCSVISCTLHQGLECTPNKHPCC